MVKLFSTLLCLLFAYFSVFSANASLFFGAGAGVTEGAIVEGGWKMNPFLSLRARGGYMPSVDLKALAGGFENGGKNDGFGKIDKLNFNSKTFDIGAEVTPLPMIPIIRGFRFIGAMQYMNTGIDASTNYNNSVNFNGTPYVVNGGIDLRIQNKQKFAPYLAFAWDVINLPIVSARLTAGATYRSFDARITGLRGDIATIVPVANINAELAKLQKDIDKSMWVPSVSLTVRITLPNVPFVPVV